MFKRKKWENMKQEFEAYKEQQMKIIEREKEQLLFIKEQLNDLSSKIDVSNVYIFEKRGLYSLVELSIERIRGRKVIGASNLVDAYKSTLIDLFTNEILFQKCSVDSIHEKELVESETLFEEDYYVYIYPIYKFDHNLLAYTDKMVPLYVLQQLYYDINNIDIGSFSLKKTK